MHSCTFNGWQSASDISHIKASLDDVTVPMWIPGVWIHLHNCTWSEAWMPPAIRGYMQPIKPPSFAPDLVWNMSVVSKHAFPCNSVHVAWTHLWICTPWDTVHRQKIIWLPIGAWTVDLWPKAALYLKMHMSYQPEANRPEAAESSSSRHNRFTLLSRTKF